MSEALEKAKGALAHAKQLAAEHERDPKTGLFQAKAVDVEFAEAIQIANVNAQIAQAEALERIAEAAELSVKRLRPCDEPSEVVF